MHPTTRYAKSGEINIAYQIVGDGPIDVVFTFGWASHLDFQWVDPNMTRLLRRLAQFARVLVFDKRGVGLSDPVARAPTIEERMNDIPAVMDGADSERAALIGYSEGSAMSALYAASHPERVSALVLYEAWVSGLMDPELNPGGQKWLALDRMVRDGIEHWGEGETLRAIAPSIAESAVQRRMYGTFERAAMGPGMALALWESFLRADVRSALPLIAVPTLIIHHTDSTIPIENARYAHKHIPEARFVELDGADHAPITHDAYRIADEIEQFLTGVRPAPSVPDRVFATILFTDIVGSTELASRLSDAGWLPLVRRHDAAVREALDEHAGTEIQHTGDGFVATFDGASQAIRCAFAIRERLREIGVEVRCGVHAGEFSLAGPEARGLAIHVAARVMSFAGDGEVMVSRDTRDLAVGPDIAFEPRGNHTLKGAGSWELYAATPAGARQPGEEELAPLPPRMDDRAMRTLARRAPRLARSLTGASRAWPVSRARRRRGQ
jgi:pimeloyl-ACP methyl ester carboxylesterase